MMLLRLCLITAAVTFYFIPHVLARFDYCICCQSANRQGSLYSRNNQTQTLLRLTTNYTTCGQEYAENTGPAQDVYVQYRDCKKHCEGFALTKWKDPEAWAAPIVQFVLPSIIFSMSIPRHTLFLPTWTSDKVLVSLILLPIANMVMATLDTILWVAVILSLAGPLMVSGLTEAVLDYRILQACSSERYRSLDDSTRLRLITSVVCGNIRLPKHGAKPRRCPVINEQITPHPAREIPRALEKQEPGRVRLALFSLMGAQGDFGALVGALVVFYIGGFVYTLIDLLTDPSAQSAAISLAFGVNWMMVVHVAIISGCLLASNNPNAVCVLAGGHKQVIKRKRHHLPLTYETPFQPVSMWQRGSNKRLWLDSITATGTDVIEQTKVLLRIRHDVTIGLWGYMFLIFVPTAILIGLPPAAGAFVAWKTPPIGWGCRSLTLVIYAACQLIMIVAQEARNYLSQCHQLFPWSKTCYTSRRERLASHIAQLFSIVESGIRWIPQVSLVVFCFLSAFTAVGGTIMQIAGVYGNCFCYVNAQMWFRLDEAFVNVASDTFDQRHSSKNWITMGVVATGFMALCSYFGWAYQRAIRAQYEKHVEMLYKT